MDVANNLTYTYEEQCFIQSDRLKKELIDEEMQQGDRDRWQCHRLYRNNFFDEIDIRKQKRCDQLLIYNLKSLGEHLNSNIISIVRDARSSLHTPTPIRDLSVSVPSSPVTRSRSSSWSLSQASSIMLISNDRMNSTTSNQTDSDSQSNTNQQVPLADITSSQLDCIRDDDQNNYPPNSILLVDRRIMSNYNYDSYGVIHLKPKKHIRFFPNKSRQALMLTVIAKVLKLIGTDKYMTQRELYYLTQDFCRCKLKNRNTSSQSQNNPIFSLNTNNSQATRASQVNSDNRVQYSNRKLDCVLSDLCCLLGCSRVHLHVLAQVKGVVYGDLKYQLKKGGEIVDCLARKEGVQIPNSNNPISKVESNAKFIIVLEKDSILQRVLNQESKTNFIRNYKVIMITAKGYPDVNTRVFLNFLWSKLNIPILALTDADPHGFEIVCSYKFGCYQSAYEGPNAAIPQMRWLGLLPSDVAKLSIPESKTLPQTDIDRRKISSLLSRPYLRDKPAWKDQLVLMQSTGRKAEVEILDDSGEFLVSTYLPNKLRFASWL